MNDNYAKAKEYYNRMLTLDPNNKDYKIQGYNALAQLDTKMVSNEKTIEGRLLYLDKAQESYNKILAIDQGNEPAARMLKWTQDSEAQVRKGINPNELKGTVKECSTDNR